ncbi:MAG: beta-lactamase family protein, partial [Pseudobdellovibrionaceae bacterium]|nr:beta-lactamase family protein [Pseudobdellovibrionaceae bacterium]
MRFRDFISAGLILLTPACAREKTIDAIITESLASAGASVAGLSIAIHRDQEVLFEKAYGWSDLENKTKMTPDSILAIGSITKQFTAAAIMKLVDEGQLNLDDKVSKILTDSPLKAANITVRHLLTHQSGLGDFEYTEQWMPQKALRLSSAAMEKMIATVPLTSDKPGQIFAYSSSGYYLLGRIIETISGQPLGTYLEQQIFQAAGLKNTYWCDEATLIPFRAHGYGGKGGYTSELKELVNADLVHLPQYGGAGALCSTARDLIVWQKALEDGRVISHDAWQQMKNPINTAAGVPTHYGFGTIISAVADHKLIGHSGAVPGFTADSSWYPDSRLHIVVLCNSESTVSAVLSRRLAALLLNIPEPGLKPASEQLLQELSGTFKDESGATFEFFPDQGKLGLRVNGKDRPPFLYDGGRRFTRSDRLLHLTFGESWVDLDR